MLGVSAMWMVNAWRYGSWEQMAAIVLSAAASLYGACRLGPTVPAAVRATST